MFILKKDRNCECNYPVYPTYPGMVPMMNQGIQPMMPNQGMYSNMVMPNNIGMPTVPNTNTMIGNDYQSLMNQVNNLERRVSRLENMMNSNNNMTPKYNESNYYMV